MKTTLITALDFDVPEQAYQVVEELLEEVNFFKVGIRLFTAAGPESVKYLKKKNCRVFLDLKFHDIPHTVGEAVKTCVSLGVELFTIHASGGQDMIKEAKQAVVKEAQRLKVKAPKVMAVTVLTSRQSGQIFQEVFSLSKLAVLNGADGLVCSADEALALRKEFPDTILVTPGIRFPEQGIQDQKRVATPEAAKKAGVDYIVVGRPIIEASSKLEAARKFTQAIK